MKNSTLFNDVHVILLCVHVKHAHPHDVRHDFLRDDRDRDHRGHGELPGNPQLIRAHVHDDGSRRTNIKKIQIKTILYDSPLRLCVSIS